MGEGGHQPGSRKQFSLTALKQEEISFIQVLGEVAGSDRSLEVGHSKPHLDLQQAQGVQAGPGCIFFHKGEHTGAGGWSSVPR